MSSVENTLRARFELVDLVSRVLLFLALGISGCGPKGGDRAVAPRTDPLSNTDADTLYAQGQGYANVGDLVRAEQYIVAALDKGYPPQDALSLLIEVCVAGNRFDTALQHARPHLAANPDNTALRYLVSTLYSAVGQTEKAADELRRVLVDDPQNPSATFAMGELLWKRGDKEDAVTKFERYLELAPEGPQASDARSYLGQWKIQMRPREVTPDASVSKSAEEEDGSVVENSTTESEGVSTLKKSPEKSTTLKAQP